LSTGVKKKIIIIIITPGIFTTWGIYLKKIKKIIIIIINRFVGL